MVFEDGRVAAATPLSVAQADVAKYQARLDASDPHTQSALDRANERLAEVQAELATAQAEGDFVVVHEPVAEAGAAEPEAETV